MKSALAAVLHDQSYARELARRGLETIAARHTCGHRVSELLRIVAALGKPAHAVQHNTLEAVLWD
jgi:spore maturation protein CgeB